MKRFRNMILIVVMLAITATCCASEPKMAAGFDVRYACGFVYEQGWVGEADYDKLEETDIFWCAKLIPLDVYQTLRAIRPEQIMLHYQSSFTVSTKYQWTMPTFPENKPDEWFMKTSDGELMRWSHDPTNWYYDRFFLDIGNPDVVEYLVNDIVTSMLKYRQEGYDFDGVALDNVLLSAWWEYKNQQHPEGWTYSGVSDYEWTNIFFDYVEILYDALKKEGFKVYVNHTLDYIGNSDEDHWERLFTIADGFMHEHALIHASGVAYNDTEIDWTIDHHLRTIAAGKETWLWCNPTNYEEQLLCRKIADLVDGYLRLPLYEKFKKKDKIKINNSPHADYVQ